MQFGKKSQLQHVSSQPEKLYINFSFYIWVYYKIATEENNVPESHVKNYFHYNVHPQ